MAAAGRAHDAMFTRAVTFGRLEIASCIHSCVYLTLLICAFVLNNPEPATFRSRVN